MLTAERCRQWRQELGISQSRLASQALVRQDTVSRFETDRGSARRSTEQALRYALEAIQQSQRTGEAPPPPGARFVAKQPIFYRPRPTTKRRRPDALLYDPDAKCTPFDIGYFVKYLAGARFAIVDLFYGRRKVSARNLLPRVFEGLPLSMFEFDLLAAALGLHELPTPHWPLLYWPEIRRNHLTIKPEDRLAFGTARTLVDRGLMFVSRQPDGSAVYRCTDRGIAAVTPLRVNPNAD